VKTTLQIVTPERAREWLKKNTDNRRLRPFAVDELHGAWERGEWKVTHQGIAFSKSGRLLDGQHRLTFISQLPEGEGVAINVSTDCEEDVFGAIDQHIRRTLSDVTGVGADLAALGRFLAKVQNSSQNTGLTPQFVVPFISWALPAFSELVTFSPNKAPVWSSAAVRAAAVFQINGGHDIDFVKLSYDSLVRSDIDAMPFGARALAQQRMSGKIVSARSLDLFCRALRAFDSTKRMKIKSILVLDQAKTLAEVRTVLDHLAKKGPDEAGPTVAKPSANSKALRVA
jgi:hypothetical protein